MTLRTSCLRMPILPLAILLLAATPTLAEGELDGAWTEVKWSAKGVTLSDADRTFKKNTKGKGLCYGRLGYDTSDPPAFYELFIYCETSPGTWELLATDGPFIIEEHSSELLYVSDRETVLQNPSGEFVQAWGTYVADVKLKDGAVKNLKWKTLGAEAFNGDFDPAPDTFFLGTQNLKLKLIDLEDVPAEVLAAAGAEG